MSQISIATDLYEYYKQYRPRRKLKRDDKKEVYARVKEGYTLQDMKDAVDGMFKHHKNSAFWTGENDRGTKYDQLFYCLRAKNIDDFIEATEEFNRTEKNRLEREVEAKEVEAQRRAEMGDLRKRGYSAAESLKAALRAK